METDSVLVMQTKADIRYHQKEVWRWNNSLNLLKQKKKGKHYRQASSDLYHYLIEFYGATDGKRKWASHIRERNNEIVTMRNQRKYHQREMTRLKRMLALYLAH